MLDRNHKTRRAENLATLGLQEGASVEEVKVAFRSLALQHHPDRVEHSLSHHSTNISGSKVDSSAFHRVSTAYHALLSDPAFGRCEKKIDFSRRDFPNEINPNPGWYEAWKSSQFRRQANNLKLGVVLLSVTGAFAIMASGMGERRVKGRLHGPQRRHRD
mmetsp:Transcript_38642/g.74085  ORF Transcript_38642/g.74085 Transcript_38642/m.74085 type:complete len:160 (+) Transcript_38642:90-569(+)